MNDDIEIQAMTALASALQALDEPARKRVLNWAFSRFTAGSIGCSAPAADLQLPPGPGVALNETGGSFETFAELFSASVPKSESEKALLAAYWTQIVRGQTSFAAQTLNSELKDLGHGIGNITDALTALKHERPALALQLKKSGTSRQARKTYKLTQEGIRRVRGMLTSDE